MMETAVLRTTPETVSQIFPSGIIHPEFDEYMLPTTLYGPPLHVGELQESVRKADSSMEMPAVELS